MRAGYPSIENATPVTWVAIDIAKDAHVVLVQTPTARRSFRVGNRLDDIERLIAFLWIQPQPVRIAFEPTGVYHRPLAYRLVCAGFDVVLISSLACSRYREARYTSWDKNDPKDTAVLLELLQQGITMPYVDPLVAGWHDIQEVAKTYWHVTLARTRVQHSPLKHYLPLYRPEFVRYWRTSRTEAFITMLLAFPTPVAITAHPCAAFLDLDLASAAAGRKVGKRAWLEGLYELAQRSVALPVPLASLAVETFKLRLQAFFGLTAQRAALEAWADRAARRSPRTTTSCKLSLGSGPCSPSRFWLRRATCAGSPTIASSSSLRTRSRQEPIRHDARSRAALQARQCPAPLCVLVCRPSCGPAPRKLDPGQVRAPPGPGARQR
jgi:Transposase